MTRLVLALVLGLFVAAVPVVFGQAQAPPAGARVLRAGAATSNVTPPLGAGLVGGWSTPASTDVHDELQARCLVLDDGTTRVAFAIVDNVSIDREVFDEAERLLMAATHTHSGPSASGLTRYDFGEPLDEYQAFLARRIADGVRRAIENLAPARIAWGAVDVPQHVFNRRWLVKDPARNVSPFGQPERALMNPGAGNPNITEPAGPTDPQVSFISVQAVSGRPIAFLANYSLHYVGGVPNGHVSADYFAVFARQMAQLLEVETHAPPFVAILSNGTSGNINNINFRGGQQRLPPYARMGRVANQAAAEVFRAMQGIDYHEYAPLKMVQRELRLKTRRAEAEKLTGWAKDVLARPESMRPNHPRERIYAQRILNMLRMPPELDVPLQALRIGELAIVTIPFEAFVEMGIDLKARSPFPDTFVVSLANGSYGYLPTAAHHQLGGYETWLGTNQVEVGAAQKIVDALLEMLGELK
jgi:hypothetical protein